MRPKKARDFGEGAIPRQKIELAQASARLPDTGHNILVISVVISVRSKEGCVLRRTWAYIAPHKFNIRNIHVIPRCGNDLNAQEIGRTRVWSWHGRCALTWGGGRLTTTLYMVRERGRRARRFETTRKEGVNEEQIGTQGPNWRAPMRYSNATRTLVRYSLFVHAAPESEVDPCDDAYNLVVLNRPVEYNSSQLKKFSRQISLSLVVVFPSGTSRTVSGMVILRFRTVLRAKRKLQFEQRTPRNQQKRHILAH